jgi:nitrogen fixation/metabolism regulation signal transduction histidine kinase
MFNYQKIIVYISIIVALSLLFSLSIFFYKNLFLIFSLFAFIIIFSIFFWYQINQTRRELAEFLTFIKFEDYSNFYSTKLRKQDVLKNAFHEVFEQFRKLKAEREANALYLKTMLEHISIALICYNQDNEIEQMNKAAKQLLKINFIKNIQSISKIDENLSNCIINLPSGKKELIKVNIKSEPLHLSISATEFTLQGMKYKIISMQNLQQEIENTEADAWQKLVRVLTHEIMNSVTPISSLSRTVNQMLGLHNQKPNIQIISNELDREDLDDIKTSLLTIENRSKGLINFVKSYKSFTNVPQPNIRSISSKELLERVINLLKPDFSSQNIHIKLILPTNDIILNIDLEMIEQVFINLLLNARDAFGEANNPKLIEIELQSIDKEAIIYVKDNGKGIEKDVLNQIFIPFFTTKKTGSGIGLSLSRQFVLKHQGNMIVHSEVGKGTIFEIRLPIGGLLETD